MTGTRTDQAQSADRSFGYQPALDGIRAIAIAMVLMVHTQIRGPQAWMTDWSSWLGVDVFFVLSGFLITALLLQEVDRRGKVDLVAFYIRRFLRLYPMIVVVVLISLVTMVVLPLDHRYRTGKIGTASIALYFSNWMVIVENSKRPLGMFGHLWSLAIEEQFYLVWPLVVIACLALGSRRVLVFAAAAVGAAASAIYRATVWQQARSWDGDVTFAERTARLGEAGTYWYHSSFTRVDGLLIGCALAVLVAGLRGPTADRVRAWLLGVSGWSADRLRRVGRRTIGALGLLGAVVAEWIVQVNHGMVFPEFLIGPGLPLFEVAVGLVIVHVVINRAGLFARVLSWKPLVWTGRRSYAIYVLHPVFILPSQNIADTQPVRALAVVVTFVVAGLSYRYYEAPILRLKSRFGAGREAPETATAREEALAGSSPPAGA